MADRALIEDLRHENASLRESIAKLREENAALKSRPSISSDGDATSNADRQTFAKALVLLEDVYRDFVTGTKQKMLYEIKRDADAATSQLVSPSITVFGSIAAVCRVDRATRACAGNASIDRARQLSVARSTAIRR